MVETLRFTTDAGWRKFLEEELGWQFTEVPEVSLREHRDKFPPERYPCSKIMAHDFTVYHQKWTTEYKLILWSHEGPIELYELSRRRERLGPIRSLGEPILQESLAVYPNLRTFFREMCRNPPDQEKVLGNDLLMQLCASGWGEYTFWCLRKRIAVAQMTLREIFPEDLEKIIVNYLEPPCKKVFWNRQELNVHYQGEEGKLLLGTVWHGEAVVVIELMVI